MAKKSVAKPAPIPSPVTNGAAASVCAEALRARVERNLDGVREAFQAAEHRSANGPFEDYTLASEAFDLRPEDLLSWVPITKHTKDPGALELEIRALHNRTAPDSAPEYKEYMAELRRLASQASPSAVVDKVREELKRKNFPANANATPESMADGRAGLDAKMAQARGTGDNARTVIVARFIEAIGDADKLAAVDRLYNAVETRNGLWRSSLMLKFIANDIRELCQQYDLTPGLVWEKATKAAASVHKDANNQGLTTGESIVEAMRKAAKEHVKAFGKKRAEAPTVKEDEEKIAAAKQLVFKNLRALHSFNELDASQYESLVNFFKDSLQWKDEEQAKKDAKDAEKQLKEAQTRIAKELAAEEKKQRERALARGKGKVVPIKGKGLVFRAPAPNQASETKPATVAAVRAAKKQGKVAKGPKVEATEAAAPVTPAPVPDVMQALEENNASA